MRVVRTLALAVTMAVVAWRFPSASICAAGATVFRVVKTASASQQWTPDRPLFVLLIGDDLRPGAGCGCSDAIHLVGIPAGGGSGVMIDIPRDTRVNIPGAAAQDQRSVPGRTASGRRHRRVACRCVDQLRHLGRLRGVPADGG